MAVSCLQHALCDAVLRGDQESVLHLAQLLDSVTAGGGGTGSEGGTGGIDAADERGLTALHWSAASKQVRVCACVYGHVWSCISNPSCTSTSTNSPPTH